MTTKIDIINAAFSRLRISGLTVQATPEDIDLALNRLEGMAREWHTRVNSGYFFETSPASNTPHNVPREYWAAYESNLAIRMAPDFGKEITAALLMEARATYSNMSARLALVKPVRPPARQPIGSGNRRFNQADQYYQPQEEAPLSPDTVQIYVGDISDFYFDFQSDLLSGEDIQSYVLTSDDAVVITTQLLTSPRVNYTIRADGPADDAVQVKIVATFDTGRILTKIRNFVVNDADITG